jgi:hypothetical protein
MCFTKDTLASGFLSTKPLHAAVTNGNARRMHIVPVSPAINTTGSPSAWEATQASATSSTPRVLVIMSRTGSHGNRTVSTSMPVNDRTEEGCSTDVRYTASGVAVSVSVTSTFVAERTGDRNARDNTLDPLGATTALVKYTAWQHGHQLTG